MRRFFLLLPLPLLVIIVLLIFSDACVTLTRMIARLL